MHIERWRRLLILLLAAIFAMIAFSQELQVTEHIISSPKITEEITLAVASDLHNSFYGAHQEELISEILSSGADALLMPGDMADSFSELDGVRTLVEGLKDKIPIFYTTGNHECSSGDHKSIKKALRELGVNVLEGNSVMLGEIRIAGTDDPLCLYRQEWKDQIAACRSDDNVFTVLLAHRPDRIADYSAGFDLIISGHAHGGQLRIPGILPGLYAPNQGWFPDYTSGLYPAGEGEMFVSRGLARSSVPRIFNRPELAILHILPEQGTLGTSGPQTP